LYLLVTFSIFNGTGQTSTIDKGQHGIATGGKNKAVGLGKCGRKAQHKIQRKKIKSNC
jgi:hypothetical protein